MRLSIITVNYRSWSHLQAALDGLLRAPEFARTDWEMIVVDNASGDGRLQAFRKQYPQVAFIENEGNLGFASGNNIGAAAASGTDILFMNPDIRAEPDEIRKLLADKEAHPDIAILSAIQFDGRGRLQKSFDRFPFLLTYFRSLRGLMRMLAPGRFPDPRRFREGLVRCDWVSGSLLLIGRAQFGSLGGWSEDFWMYAEDMDLCKRAQDLGLARAVTAGARFVHIHGGASRRNRETTLITKGEAMIAAHVFIERHYSAWQRPANHAVVATRNLAPLMLATIASVLTLGLVPRLRLRVRLLGGLLSYYRSVVRTGIWLSKRAPNYPALPE